jgi:hypothetical protein
MARTPTGQSLKVLETYPAGAFQYQLAVEPGIIRKEAYTEPRKAYPMSVRLLKNGKPADKKILRQAAASPDFERQPGWDEPHPDPESRIWRFDRLPGRAAENPEKLWLWQSGHESDYVGVLARPVALGAKYPMLLVTQLAGFEHLYRNHALYRIDNGKLEKVWSFSEAGRPMYTTVSPVRIQNRPALLFWQTRWGWQADEREADVHQISLLRWQNDKAVIETTPLPTLDIPLYAVAINFYPDVAQARQAAKAMVCDIEAPALERASDAYPFPGIEIYALDYPPLAREGNILLGHVFFTAEEARNYQSGLQHCMPATGSRMFPAYADQ